MAVTYAANAKNERMNGVKTAIDAGGAAGKLEIGTTAMGSVLATIVLDYPTPSASGGTLTLFSSAKTDTADATGTAGAARIRTSANADVITGLSVGTSGSDINLDSTSITSGQTVQINSAAISHG